MAFTLSTGLKNALLNNAGLKSALANGQIRIFNGVRPQSADDAESGAVLCIITLNSAAMVSGVVTNGLVIDTPSGGAVGIPSGAVWSGKNLATGNATWFRWYPNTFDAHQGVATGGDKIRLDGNCAAGGGGDLNLSTTNLKINVPTTVDNVNLYL
jgi:hypothetical protein